MNKMKETKKFGGPINSIEVVIDEKKIQSQFNQIRRLEGSRTKVEYALEFGDPFHSIKGLIEDKKIEFRWGTE